MLRLSRDATSTLIRVSLSIGFVLFVGTALGERIYEGRDLAGRVLLLIGALAIGALPMMVQSWRIGMVFTIVYLTFSGFFNHLSGYHTFTRTLKFALLVWVLCHWLFVEVFERIRRDKPISYPLAVPFLVFVAWNIIQMFNPHWSSVLNGLKAGVAGMVMHVLPMALIFLGYDFVTRRRQITTFLIFVSGLALVMASFGIVQHIVGIEQVTSWGSSFSSTIHREVAWGRGFQHVMKPISFAQDAGAAAAYYLIGILCSVMLFLHPGNTSRTRLLIGAIIIVLAISLFLTQVRLAFMTSVGAVIFFAITGNYRSLIVLVLFAVAFLLTYFLYQEDVRYVLINRYEILQNPFSAATAHRGMQARIVLIMARNYPFGTGIGRAGPGAYIGAQADSGIGIAPGENYYANVIVETGWIGVGLVLFMFVMIIRQGWLHFWGGIQDRVLQLYSLGCVALLIMIMISGMGGPALYSTPLNVFFWFLAGLLFKLPVIERTEEGVASGELDDREDIGSLQSPTIKSLWRPIGS